MKKCFVGRTEQFPSRLKEQNADDIVPFVRKDVSSSICDAEMDAEIFEVGPVFVERDFFNGLLYCRVRLRLQL